VLKEATTKGSYVLGGFRLRKRRPWRKLLVEKYFKTSLKNCSLFDVIEKKMFNHDSVRQRDDNSSSEGR
jgi:hypothetical protein